MAQKKKHSAFDGRTTRHAGYAVSLRILQNTRQPPVSGGCLYATVSTTLDGLGFYIPSHFRLASGSNKAVWSLLVHRELRGDDTIYSNPSSLIVYEACR